MRALPDVRSVAESRWSRLQQLPDRWLFGASAERVGLAGGLLRATRFPYALLRDLIDGQLGLRAMGLVYETLLAIVPLLAFSFGILRAFNAQGVLAPLLQDFFAPMGAPGNELTLQVMAYANKVRGALVGSVGLALLIWTLLGTMKKVEDGFNFIWHVDVPRNLARRLSEYLALLIIGPVLLAAVIGLTRLAQASLPLLDRLSALGLRIAPYLVISGLLTVLYKIIPNTPVRFGPALTGGIVAGTIWAAIGRIFTLFVLSSARLTAVYAGLAIIVAALIWTYLNWIILLLGAQVSFYAQNPIYLRLGLDELRLSCTDTERLALGIMYRVAERHRSGGARLNVAAISSELGYPGIAVARLCTTLERAGYLAAADDETLLPGRDIAQIRVFDILAAARDYSCGLIRTADSIPSAVSELCAQLDLAWRQRCADLSLGALLSPPSAPAGHDASLAGDGHGLDQ